MLKSTGLLTISELPLQPHELHPKARGMGSVMSPATESSHSWRSPARARSELFTELGCKVEVLACSKAKRGMMAPGFRVRGCDTWMAKEFSARDPDWEPGRSGFLDADADIQTRFMEARATDLKHAGALSLWLIQLLRMEAGLTEIATLPNHGCNLRSPEVPILNRYVPGLGSPSARKRAPRPTARAPGRVWGREAEV